MVSSKVTDLGRLGLDDVSGMVDVFIDEVLVLNIDKWAKEGNDSSKKSKTPEWKQLDEEVGDEGAQKGTDCHPDILNEYNALEFNDDKVDQLLDVLSETFK